MQEHPQTILFISLSCVGDAVMTTPVLESLHMQFPEAVIDIVSDSRSDILYRHCPYRRNIFLKNKKRFLRGSLGLLREVRKNKYDLIVDLRTDGLAYLCKGEKKLTKWGAKSYGRHAVQRLMGVIRKVHQDRPVPPAKIWLTEKEHEDAVSLLSALPDGRWLAFVPGNINSRKIWPAENYAGLANAMKNIFSGVILEGSRGEKKYTEAVAEKLELPFVDLAGKTNLLQAAAILQRAGLFVGADSGLGHIAAAMGTPTLTFFSVDRPERVLPWGGNPYWLASPDENTGNIPLESTIEKVKDIYGA